MRGMLQVHREEALGGDQPGNVSQLQTAGRAGIRAHGRPAASSLLSSSKAAQLREGV